MMRAQVIGSTRISGLQEVLGAVTAAAAAVGPFLRNLLGGSGSYNPANGGEVMRQLQGNGDMGRPWVDSFCDWLQRFRPDVWQSGDIWDFPGTFAHRSYFKDHYEALMAAGLPAGIRLDQNGNPEGLDRAAAAVVAADGTGWSVEQLMDQFGLSLDDIIAGEGIPPRPGTTTPGGGAPPGDRPTTTRPPRGDRNNPPEPPQAQGGSLLPLLALGAVGLLLFKR